MTDQFSLSTLHDRLSMRLDRESGLQNLDEIVLKHGRIGGEPFSFEGHEFQRQIIRDTSNRIAVRKASQVGLSELQVQKMLAMAATMSHVRFILTLPTKDFAISFSKDRIDSALEQSPFYSGMTSASTNSAGQKKIGSCMVYVTGSFGANSAISIPAEVLIHDEVDFSNSTVLGKLNSRLRHATAIDKYGNRGTKIMFSTPTVSNFGIDLEFQKGDQQYYQVKCDSCGHWQIPGMEHFRVPGWKDCTSELTRNDAYHLSDDLHETTVHCEKCKKDLFSSLINPENRAWVPLYTADRPVRSYQVNPLDVPTFNTPGEIVRQLMEYPLRSDFFNFVLGLPYTDADNTFMTDDLHKMNVMKADYMTYLAGVVTATTVAGMDVGKVCHFVVGISVGKYLHVVNAEEIENSKNNPATPQILKRIEYYRCAQVCIDSGPDISLVNSLTSAREEVTAVVYVRELKGPKLFEVKQSEPVVNVDRTKSMSYMLAKHNSGEILYPRNEAVTGQIFDHLESTKKIRRQNADGTFTEMFTKTEKPDHYVHAMHYCLLAAEMAFGLGAGEARMFAPVEVGVVRLGSNTEAGIEQAERDRLRKLLVW